MKAVYLKNVDIQRLTRSFGGSFKLISNNRSSIYRNDKIGYLLSDKHITAGGLKIIQQVKSDVKKNYESGKFSLHCQKPNYFMINNSYFEDDYGDIAGVEIDLVKAYVNVAYRNNIISEKIYRRLLSISSEMRKQAIGALGVKKNIQLIQDYKVISNERKVDEFYNSVWDEICALLDEEMKSVAFCNWRKFVFYWFDNYFSLDVPRSFNYDYRLDFFEAKWRKYACGVKLTFHDGRYFILPIKKQKYIIEGVRLYE